jgi:MOSC domain-containing protein YiiM
LVPLPEATLVEGRGIEGDRYFAGEGTFDSRRSGTDVTLIEDEAIEAARRGDHGLEIEAWDARRNIVTRGIRLNDLVGQELRIGDVVVRGVRLCHPCGHLEELTRPGIQAALRGRGGLRADIVRGGVIRAGDRIEVVASEPQPQP